MNGIPEGLALHDIRTYGPGQHIIDPDELPGIVAMRVVCIGGDGGRSATGNPGGRGEQWVSQLYRPTGPQRLSVGRGGRGANGGQDGQDGSVIVELYGVMGEEA